MVEVYLIPTRLCIKKGNLEMRFSDANIHPHLIPYMLLQGFSRPQEGNISIIIPGDDDEEEAEDKEEEEDNIVIMQLC